MKKPHWNRRSSIGETGKYFVEQLVLGGACFRAKALGDSQCSRTRENLQTTRSWSWKWTKQFQIWRDEEEKTNWHMYGMFKYSKQTLQKKRYILLESSFFLLNSFILLWKAEKDSFSSIKRIGRIKISIEASRNTVRASSATAANFPSMTTNATDANKNFGDLPGSLCWSLDIMRLCNHFMKAGARKTSKGGDFTNCIGKGASKWQENLRSNFTKGN